MSFDPFRSPTRSRDAARRVLGPLPLAAALAGVGGPALAEPTTFTDAGFLMGVNAFQAPSNNLAFSSVNVSAMVAGGAIGDFNRDGWPDIFVLSGGNAPDRLLMNQGGDSFVDHAAQWDVDRPHIGIGCCVGDYDGDGWLDVFVVSFGESSQPGMPVVDHHLLYRNLGGTGFEEVGEQAGVRTLGHTVPSGWGPAFGDYDLDGDLDLAVPSWTGEGTVLFRNEGDGTFTDATVEAGVLDESVMSFSARFCDMNGDRYPELLVASDFGTSRYWANDGDGTFTDATTASGTGLDGNGMGHALADFDGNGLPDWFVTSIYSTTADMFGVPGTGNFLYLNQGGHVFTVPEDSGGTVDGGWGWGTEPIDIDHDGFVDLVETNGWPLGNGNGQAEWLNESCYVYRNLGDGTFVDVAAETGLVWDGQGRGLVRTDFDRDGDQDVVIFANYGTMKIMRNDLVPGPDRAWLRVELDTSANPVLAPDGFGARVEVRVGKQVRHGWVCGGNSFSGTGELDVHFGLGAATTVDELRVRWSDGTVTRLEDVAVNQHLRVASGFRSDLDADGAVGFGDLLALLARFGTPDAEADLDADGTVGTTDLQVLLVNWGVGG